MTKFRDLAIGDNFDWISPDIGMTSFYRKCWKISARKYVDETDIQHQVGSLNAKVYHVNGADQ